MLAKIENTEEYKEIYKCFYNNESENFINFDASLKSLLNKYDKYIIDNNMFYISILFISDEVCFNEINNIHTQIYKSLFEYGLYRSMSCYLFDIDELNNCLITDLNKYEIIYNLLSNLKPMYDVDKYIEYYEIDKKILFKYVIDMYNKNNNQDSVMSSFYNMLNLLNYDEITAIDYSYFDGPIKLIFIIAKINMEFYAIENKDILKNDIETIINIIDKHKNIYNMFSFCCNNFSNIIINNIHNIFNMIFSIIKILPTSLIEHEIIKYIPVCVLFNENLINNNNIDNVINIYYNYYISELQEDDLYVWDYSTNLQFCYDNYINTFMITINNGTKIKALYAYKMFVRFYNDFDKYISYNKINSNINNDMQIYKYLKYILNIIDISNNLINYFNNIDNCEFYISCINKYRHIIKITKFELYENVLHKFDKMTERYLKELSRTRQDAG